MRTPLTDGIGAEANLASPSFVERMIWTPVTFALAASLWRAARDPSIAPFSSRK
jgi:hypothetical protein